MTTKVYHDGAVLDMDDTVESIANYFRDVNVERAHSLARLIDKKILESFLDELVHEGTAAPRSASGDDRYALATSSTDGTAPTVDDGRRHTTGLGYQKANRDIFFSKAQSADVSTQTTIFEGEDLEDVRKVLVSDTLMASFVLL